MKRFINIRSGIFPLINACLFCLAVIPVACSKVEPGGSAGPDGPSYVIPETDPLDIPPAGFADEPDDKSADIDGVFTYSKLVRAGHPRLLMTSGDFADLKSKLTGERALDYLYLYRINKMILSHADVYVEDLEKITIALDASGRRNSGMSHLAEARLLNCAYAYRVTGKKVYLDKVKADLAQVCAMPSWWPDHFLDAAEMALGVAIAYDWCYYQLDYGLRVQVRKKLLDYAVKAASGQSFYSNRNNWNQVCNAGVIAAALVTYEQNRPDARAAIEKGISTNKSAMANIYSPDGNYSEGYGYWNYGTEHEVILLKMLDRIFGNMAGLEKTPGFSRTAEYMLYMVGPTGMDFSYADGGACKERPLFPMWWFAAWQNNPGLLMNEIKMFDGSKYPVAASDDARLMPVIPCFIKDFKFDASSVKAPEKLLWVGQGVSHVAIARSGWTGGADDCYFGVKGNEKIGHGHMDGGAFVFDALGVRWSQDYQRPNYADMEVKTAAAGGSVWDTFQTALRWDIFKYNNYSHSTLAFMTNDGSVSKLHPTDQIANASAGIIGYDDSDTDAVSVTLDLTPVYADAAERVIRTVTLRNRRYLEIKDEIKAKPGFDAAPRWRMNTPSTDVAVQENAIRMVQTDASKKERTMFLKVSSDSGNVPELACWPAERPSEWAPRPGWDYGLNGCFVGWDSTVPAGGSVTFTTVITPDF